MANQIARYNNCSGNIIDLKVVKMEAKQIFAKKNIEMIFRS